MYEYEVLLKNGEHTFIWGYNYQDALNRHPKLANEIESLLFQEGDPLEIYTTDGGVLFRKYTQPSETKAATAQKWLEDNTLSMRATSAKFSIENKTTTCEVVSNNSRQIGTATATAQDTFIPAVGMVIAFYRATGRTVPQELLED